MAKNKTNNEELIRNNLPSALLAEYDAITEEDIISPPALEIELGGDHSRQSLGMSTKTLYTLCMRHQSSSKSLLLWSLFWTTVAGEFGRPGYFVAIGSNFQVFDIS
ncbi:MAG: hypothetical protein WC650_05240 [Candidatus Doudnabacteria bacterium]